MTYELSQKEDGAKGVDTPGGDTGEEHHDLVSPMAACQTGDYLAGQALLIAA